MSSEGKNAVKQVKIENCSVVLSDVAGTTTSINFVKDTLFPFVLKQVEPFLQSKWDEESIKTLVKEFQEKEEPLELASVVELVKSLTEKESDSKPLKTLQGLIYAEGYDKGDLKAHVYEDVPSALEKWQKTRKIAIYSTGSVESQKQLFKNTILGDLSSHICNYFDQSVGSKVEADSYKEIAKVLDVEPETIVFLTDNIEEAKAAKSSKLQTVLVKREGNAELAEDAVKDFSVVESFEEICLENVAKRKTEEPLPEEPPSKIAKADETEAKTEEVMEVEKPATEEKPAAEEPIKEAEKTEETPMETATTTETTTTAETTTATTETTTTTETPTATTETSSTTNETSSTTTETSSTTNETSSTTTETASTTEETEKTDVKVPAVEKVEEPSSTAAKEVVEAETPAENKTEEAKEPEKSETVVNNEEPTETKKTEEKENESVLANGVENGKAEEEPEKATEAAEKPAEIENGDAKEEEGAEIKTKKIEEPVPAEPVSVGM